GPVAPANRRTSFRKMARNRDLPETNTSPTSTSPSAPSALSERPPATSGFGETLGTESGTTLRQQSPEGRCDSGTADLPLEPRLRAAAHSWRRIPGQAVVPGERHPGEDLEIRQILGKRVE